MKGHVPKSTNRIVTDSEASLMEPEFIAYMLTTENKKKHSIPCKTGVRCTVMESHVQSHAVMSQTRENQNQRNKQHIRGHD